MRFHPTDLSLLVSCDDHTIKRWQLTISEVANVYDSHVSTVTAIAFIDNETVVSAGRDSVLLFWKLDSTEPYQTIAVYEPVEDLTIREGHIFTVGVRGQAIFYLKVHLTRFSVCFQILTIYKFYTK